MYVYIYIYIRIHILLAISNAEVYKNVTLETHIICSSKLQVQFFLRPKELTSLQSAILIIYKFPSSKTLDERRTGLIFGRTATHDGYILVSPKKNGSIHRSTSSFGSANRDPVSWPETCIRGMMEKLSKTQECDGVS